MEQWRQIPSFPKWEASSLGKIRRIGKTEPMKQRKVQCASVVYLKINLGKTKGKSNSKWVHRLVCEAFHGLPPYSSSECRHLDSDCFNNKAENLRWGTKLMNLFDRFRGKNPGPCECGRLYEDHDEDGQPWTPGPNCMVYRKASA